MGILKVGREVGVGTSVLQRVIGGGDPHALPAITSPVSTAAAGDPI
jgi:hypothetical protein